MKTVSFVVPVYNPPEDRFRALLDSVLSQTGVGVEVVAVDDGSTNGAPAILREYEAANPGKTKVLRRENRGQGPSRNEGFLATTGDYVWFVDADDAVRPGAASRLASILDETGAEIVSTGFLWASPGTERPFPETWTGRVRKTSPEAELASSEGTVWNRFCRRDALERIGVRFCGAKTGEDAVEVFRWLLEARALLRYDEPCYRYVQTPGSLVHARQDVRFFADGWQVMDLYSGLCRRFPQCARWLELWNFVRARGHLFLADRFLAETDLRSPEEIEAVRRAREEYRRRFEALDPDNPLVGLYDSAREKGRRETRDLFHARLAEAGKKLDAARKRNDALGNRLAALEKRLSGRDRELASTAARLDAANRRLSAVESSLSWRLTAPLRAVLRPFARRR